MKPRRGITSIEFKWADCRNGFKKDSPIPIFSTGGGAYESFGFTDVWIYQRHYYFLVWCFLTIKGVRYGHKGVFR